MGECAARRYQNCKGSIKRSNKKMGMLDPEIEYEVMIYEERG
jgi:hypothetical protein